MSTIVRAIRVVAASVGIVLSVLILITAKRVNKLEIQRLHYALEYPYYMIISSAVSLGTIPILFLNGYLRKRSFLATVLADMCFFGIRTVVWLIGGLLTQQAIQSTSYFNCDVLNDLTEQQQFEQEFEDLKSICSGYSTFRTCSFIVCGVSFIYAFLLFVLGIISSCQGRPIWLSPVTSPGFYRPPPSSSYLDGTTTNGNGNGLPTQAPKRSEMETVHVPRFISISSNRGNTMDSSMAGSSVAGPTSNPRLNPDSLFHYNSNTATSTRGHNYNHHYHYDSTSSGQGSAGHNHNHNPSVGSSSRPARASASRQHQQALASVYLTATPTRVPPPVYNPDLHDQDQGQEQELPGHS